MAWGVEGRFPFLDREIIRLFMSLSPDMKCREVNGRKIEKYILRKSFDVKYDSSQKPVFLPDEILWRQKEQFSDGVGYSWIDTLVEVATQNITDEEMIKTFNCGIGFCIIIKQKNFNKINSI